jgi:hypothetical protein
VRDWVGLYKHQNNYELEMVLQASHLFRPTISPRLVTINIPNGISKFYLGLHLKPLQPWTNVGLVVCFIFKVSYVKLEFRKSLNAKIKFHYNSSMVDWRN